MRKVLLFLILTCAGIAAAFPAFREKFQIYSMGEMLEAGYNSSPTVADWNGDGLNDLLIACLEDVGDEKLGTIQFYPNYGTNVNPVFNDFTRIMADGEVIYTLGTC